MLLHGVHLHTGVFDAGKQRRRESKATKARAQMKARSAPQDFRRIPETGFQIGHERLPERTVRLLHGMNMTNEISFRKEPRKDELLHG